MRVLHDAVLIRKIRETQTPGGIILSDKAMEKAPTFQAEVMEIGNGEEVAKCKLRIGARVLVYSNIRGGFPQMPNNENLLIAPHEAILGIMEAGD